jgi:uncharacterized protein GlcG (DUF336 family)
MKRRLLRSVDTLAKERVMDVEITLRVERMSRTRASHQPYRGGGCARGLARGLARAGAVRTELRGVLLMANVEVARATALTMYQAEAMLAAARDRAVGLGVPVNIAVLDAGGHLKAFWRMDGAVLGSIDLAMRKARTAVLFETTSEAVWEYCKPGAPAHGLEQSNGGLAPFAGGMPLKGRHGEIVGAVGVSGGAVPQDSEIAQAAVAAFVP